MVNEIAAKRLSYGNRPSRKSRLPRFLGLHAGRRLQADQRLDTWEMQKSRLPKNCAQSPLPKVRAWLHKMWAARPM